MACGLARSDLIALSDLAIFGGLDEATLARLAAELDVVALDPGDCPIAEGEPGREVFVVLEGALEALHRAAPTDRGEVARVAELGPGDVMGEMAVLDLMPRSATVRARTRARLLRMPASQLDALYRRDPRAYALIMMNLAREISRKLRVTTSRLAGAMAELGDLQPLHTDHSARYAVRELERHRESGACLQVRDPGADGRERERDDGDDGLPVKTPAARRR